MFSRAEVAARNEIGLDKMMIGMDYPHHEGTVGIGTRRYLRETLGAAQVPVPDAIQMLATNAIEVFGFSRVKLQPIAAAAGPMTEEVLSPPDRDDVLRGDIHKPLAV